MPFDPKLLLARREEVIADFLGREKYAPEKSPEGVLLSQRPIAFVCDNRIRLVGECVDKVLHAINVWSPPEDYVDVLDGMYVRALAAARKISAENRGAKQLDLTSAAWNQINYILELQGIQCVLTEGE